MALMRYVWVDVGVPDYAKGDSHGITGYFMPMYAAQTTKAQLQDIVNHGRAAGLFVGHNWWGDADSPPKLTPAQYAEKANAFYKSVLVPGLRVQFNLEQHDPEYIASVFEAWRKLQPTVGTSWALEGMQGGWMTPDFVQRVIAAHVRVVPEAYIGQMQRVEGDAVLRNLMRRGFPESLISLFFDGEQMGVDAEGYVFTQNRLP